MESLATASIESRLPPLVRLTRCTLILAGLACLVVGMAADWLVGGAEGFGRGQLLLVIFGTVFLIAAAVVRGCQAARWTLRGMALLISLYLGLVVCDFFLELRTRALTNPGVGLKGLFVADTRTGFRLSPYFDGFFDDGVTRCHYRTNSLGHRDDEPAGGGETRILLIGDSFAFGYRLDEGETIDKQMERISGGRINVYNAGIQAYGPPAILETLKRCDWYNGDEVVYLFFGNDLRSDNLLPDMGLTAFDGFQVPKRKDDGTAYSADEYTRLIRQSLENPDTDARRVLTTALRLANLRELVRKRDRATRLLDTQGPGVYRPENVTAAVEICAEMDRIARGRGLRFSVAVLPTRGEVVHRRYAALVEAFVRELRQRDMRVIGLLSELEPQHYYDPPDIHINPAGARHVAAGLLEALSSG